MRKRMRTADPPKPEDPPPKWRAPRLSPFHVFSSALVGTAEVHVQGENSLSFFRHATVCVFAYMLTLETMQLIAVYFGFGSEVHETISIVISFLFWFELINRVIGCFWHVIRAGHKRS